VGEDQVGTGLFGFRRVDTVEPDTFASDFDGVAVDHAGLAGVGL
jgi:hypothetical protein